MNRALIVRATVLAVAFGLVAGPFTASVEAWASEPRVETVAGPVLGSDDDDLSVFRGIPYAAAPVGALRWRPPQPVKPWTEVRETREYGAICPQRQGEGEFRLRDRPMSEDCLTLNVWTPSVRSDAKLPVMVWIHGGGFRIGAGGIPLFDGSALAHRGAVVVTLNYRLGLLGIFAHPALAAEQPEAPRANYAFMDQIAALEWVRDNIAAFGGDPARVTIFGESAGGTSVLLHMISQRSRGLFAQAIVQSGGGWSRSPSLAEAELLADRVAEVVSASDPSGLRAVPADRLVEVLGQIASPLGYTPVVDGTLISQSIPEAFGTGLATKLPLMIGANTYEQNLLSATGTPLRTVLAPLPGDVVARARTLYGSEGGDDDVLGGNLFRDGGFIAPARWVARQNGGPAFVYRYAHVREARRRETPGPGHGAELMYVFDSLGAISTVARLMFGAEDEAMARIMGDCWVSFARDGIPSCGNTKWPTVTAKPDSVMVFENATAVVKNDPWRDRLDFLDAVMRPQLSRQP